MVRTISINSLFLRFSSWFRGIVFGSDMVKAWFCLDGDAGENRGESGCQAGWEPGPAQGSVTPDTLLGRDKERYVRSLAEDVEGLLNANDLRPAYRALKKFRSKSPSRASAIRTADGRLVSDMDGQMARWAEYFGQLFTVDPPTEQLHTTGLQAVDADHSIDETAPSLDEVREAVAKLKGGKAAGVCKISVELLKAGGEAMIRRLHAVLTAVWKSGTIPPDWKRGLVVPIWKGKGDRQDCNNYRGITLLSVPGKVLAHLLLTRIRSHLVKHHRPQQSGFTPGKSTTDRILALRVLVERRLIFAESLEVLVMALEALHEEAKPLGLEVSWLKTKVQVFGDLLDEAVHHEVDASTPATDSSLPGNDISALPALKYLPPRIRRSSHHGPPQLKQYNNQPHHQLNTLKRRTNTTPFTPPDRNTTKPPQTRNRP
ncbi:Transposon TX1 uncharacterized protein [Chionoecetes opilio]|uniref:Transposon TX1 uncharacterized protein n=1 Tax=Chionoecetes opilio TaxID=41210 RepID=A0A8J5D2B4_CHIOP|nr:Transposon TX1 uncharacterized protein [Chionoecetes opilio]